MTRSRDAKSAAAQVRQGDWWISRMAAATVAGLAGVAGALPGSPGALLLINNLRVRCGPSSFFSPRTWGSFLVLSWFCVLMVFQVY
jgi:hypothetical protein